MWTPLPLRESSSATCSSFSASSTTSSDRTRPLPPCGSSSRSVSSGLHQGIPIPKSPTRPWTGRLLLTGRQFTGKGIHMEGKWTVFQCTDHRKIARQGREKLGRGFQEPLLFGVSLPPKSC